MGIPTFPNVTLNVSANEIEMMVLMMNHITIEVNDWPCQYVHIENAKSLASFLSGKEPSNISLQECITIIDKKCSNPTLLKCKCLAHENLELIEQEDWDLGTMLGQLQHFDLGKGVKDQSGAQVVTEIVNFVLRRQKLTMRCYAKGAKLQICCKVYNAHDNTIDLLNATPDFTITDKKTVIAVGEIESSPYVQMIVVSLGHISSTYVKYLLGICVSKERTVNMYMLENGLTPKLVAGQMYVGDISVKAVSTEAYSFLSPEKFTNFLTKMASILQFIILDYEKRVDEFIAAFTNIPVDTDLLLRRSERSSDKRINPTDQEATTTISKKKKNQADIYEGSLN